MYAATDDVAATIVVVIVVVRVGIVSVVVGAKAKPHECASVKSADFTWIYHPALGRSGKIVTLDLVPPISPA
jgi:hypothetical protein